MGFSFSIVNKKVRVERRGEGGMTKHPDQLEGEANIVSACRWDGVGGPLRGCQWEGRAVRRAR